MSKKIVIRDNAKYYCSEKVKEYLNSSKIEFVALRIYSPNFNLIERFGKLLKKEVIYNKYYEKFVDFKQNVFNFLDTCNKLHIKELKTLMNEKFQTF